MKAKKIVSLLLSLAVMLATVAALGVSTSAVDVQTQIDIPDTEENYEINGVNYIVVRSADQMNELAAANKGGTKHYILDADLDYSGKTYTRIALYNGSFNGNGHSITGVNITMTEQLSHGIGMFATTETGTNNGTLSISNLTVGAPDKPVVVSTEFAAWATNGSCRIGTLLGYVQGTTTIENVTVYSNVNAKLAYRAGGMIGEARSTLIMRNCVFNGNVTVEDGAANNDNCPIGGLVGHCYNMNSATVENCASYGNISYANGYAGGLIGGFSNTITMTNCANYATVIGKRSAGLIADAGEKLDGKVTMNNCFNAGAVTGSTSAAGLLGTVSNHTKVQYNDTTLSNCANIGTVTSGTNAADLVANVFNESKLTVTNCGAFGAAGEFKTYEIVKEANAAATNTSADKTDAEALKFMHTNCGYAMFAIENGKIVVKDVPAEAKFIQYKKDTEANTMDIRVIGVLNTDELESYKNVGFNVTVYKAGDAEPLKTYEPQTTTAVYTSVLANEDGTITKYSAADLGATYLYTLELKNISMSGSYVLEITAFATEATDGETVVSDTTLTVSIVNGVIQ